MESYSAIKHDEVPICVTTEMKLNNTMLSERNQVQKPTYCMVSLMSNVQCRPIWKQKVH